MAKNLKLNIKNTQLAEALNLGGLKGKLKKSLETPAEKEEPQLETPISHGAESGVPSEEEPRRVKARAKATPSKEIESTPIETKEEPAPLSEEEEAHPRRLARKKANPLDPIENEPPPPLPTPFSDTRAQTSYSAVKEPEAPIPSTEESGQVETQTAKSPLDEELVEPKTPEAPLQKPSAPSSQHRHYETPPPRHQEGRGFQHSLSKPESHVPSASIVKLGPTGRHVKDLIRPPPPRPESVGQKKAGPKFPSKKPESTEINVPSGKEPGTGRSYIAAKPKGDDETPKNVEEEVGAKKAKQKEFLDVKPLRKQGQTRFDSRDRQGLRETDDEQWRKKRAAKSRHQVEDSTIRPTTLKIRLPISVKDLAVEMKLKSAQLISKLFMQGIVITLNDVLDDETTVQLLGNEFGCEIQIDTTEEERIRVTDKTIQQEIQSTDPSQLITRAPVVAFMGHVDHGKTSLIDAIRKTNRVASEAGAITQHIGAFRCSTPVGDITILDTPGHEAFSAMRARGAEVTDIVVLVVAGDEGIKQQSIEALQQAKAANVTIVVAINKSDKPNFNAETIYQQLSAHELLPEAWGGSTITVNCSALTGEGVPQLLEMLALQAEILELKADPDSRARGTVIESEMHKGLGAKTTVLVQNGTLRLGDAVVFGQFWGRLKTMHNELSQLIEEAGPSTPVEITGLSGLPEAGQEFVVVKNEREAREIAEARQEGQRHLSQQKKKKMTLENMVEQANALQKKTLNVLLRADVQGSLEALRTSLLNIQSTKIDVNIISAGVGEISESDVQLASASQAVIMGFHTQIESHADTLIKQTGVKVILHDIIYHAIDDIKQQMLDQLDKIPQENDTGAAEVRALFKSSGLGLIAGCMVTEGTIARNNKVRVIRNAEIVWKGNISSLKRVKDDVREVKKGFECGILLDGFKELAVGDILQAYEVHYLKQEL